MPNPICPFADLQLLTGEEQTRPAIYPTASALHTNGIHASAENIGKHFDKENIKVESHFGLDEDGQLIQYMPVNRMAQAQAGGNRHVVSLETWDGGVPSTPLNDVQIKKAIRWYRWLRTEWGIPTTVSTSPLGPGAGWHSKYTSWNPNGHACPGSVRVTQLRNIILPAASLDELPQPQPPEEDEMARPITHEGRSTWVRTLYKTWLNRTGDKASIEYWTKELEVGLYLNSLAPADQQVPEESIYERIEEAIAGSDEALAQP